MGARMRSGNYASASEVLRSALRTLDWEDLRAEIARSLNDPRPNIPAEQVFAKLRQKHAGSRRART